MCTVQCTINELFFAYRNISTPPPLLIYAHVRNAERLKKSAKGSNFKEDDLQEFAPLYIYIVLYKQNLQYIYTLVDSFTQIGLSCLILRREIELEALIWFVCYFQFLGDLTSLMLFRSIVQSLSPPLTLLETKTMILFIINNRQVIIPFSLEHLLDNLFMPKRSKLLKEARAGNSLICSLFIRSFAHCSFAHLFISLKSNEQL